METGLHTMQHYWIAKEEASKKIYEYIKDKSPGCIPLFCVHGYGNEPNHIIDDVISHRNKFEDTNKYFPVFVIWPCTGFFNGSFHGYRKDSDEQAPDSGAAFFKFVNEIEDKYFPRKSLMMHSMGNHVVFDGACRFDTAPEVQFENIFMVAAVRRMNKKSNIISPRPFLRIHHAHVLFCCCCSSIKGCPS